MFSLAFGFSVAASIILGLMLWAVLRWPTDQATRIREEWLLLSERCRISIETSTPLDIAGLTKVEERTFQGSPTNIHAGSGILAIEDIHNTASDHSYRACQVVTRDADRPLSDEELSGVALAFLELRSRLIAEGRHQSDDPARVGEVTAGIGLIGTNPAGCEVWSTMFLSRERHGMTSGTNEIATRPCIPPGTETPAPATRP